MMGFEEQWDNDGFLSNCSMQDAKHFYEAGAASRQAEIDALKAKVNDALEAFNDGSFNYCQKQLEEILK